MTITLEGVILIGPRGDVIVRDFICDGTEHELKIEVLRRLRLAAEATGLLVPHNPASCACVSCAMLRLSLKAQIKAEMEKGDA